jgi:hypothetical protein
MRTKARLSPYISPNTSTTLEIGYPRIHSIVELLLHQDLSDALRHRFSFRNGLTRITKRRHNLVVAVVAYFIVCRVNERAEAPIEIPRNRDLPPQKKRERIFRHSFRGQFLIKSFLGGEGSRSTTRQVEGGLSKKVRDPSRDVGVTTLLSWRICQPHCRPLSW